MRIRALILIALLPLAGCVETRVVYDGWGTFREQFGDPPPPPDDDDAGAGSPLARRDAELTGYAIKVQSFEGADRYRRANDMMRRLASKGVGGLWLRETGQGVTVYRGRFETKTDLDAQRQLLETREIEFDGLKPYESIGIVTLSGGKEVEQRDPADLRAYAGYYTLQIGYYDQEYGPDFRKAAEAAARELRGEGEQAYYYHGRYRSMVTIGLFTDDDFDRAGAVHVYGPRILELQRKYPYNLGNGRTIVQTFREGKKVEQREQASSLVRVPAN